MKKSIDTNKDGVLSDEEIDAAIKVLNKAKQQNRIIDKQKKYLAFKNNF